MTLLPPISDEPILCPLFCGAARHDEPAPARYGMTCPGYNADLDEVNKFTQELAWRTEVAAAYGETLASSDEYVELLHKRRTEADQRIAAGFQWKLDHPDEPHKNPLRSEVSHADLVAAANVTAAEVKTKLEEEAKRPIIEEFEPVGKPLRVPLKDLSRRGPRIEMPGKDGVPEAPPGVFSKPLTDIERKQAEHLDDAALFIDPEGGD